jgi:hypothetical protein
MKNSRTTRPISSVSLAQKEFLPELILKKAPAGVASKVFFRVREAD